MAERQEALCHALFSDSEFSMCRKLCFTSIFLSITLLIAADPPWMAKRIAEWSDKDAYLILSDSPWAKKTAASLTRLMTAAQRREGGDMAAQGGGHGGIGLENAGTLVGRGSGGAISRPGQGPEADHLKLAIRWESAMPVQAAELKTHDSSAPELDGEDYAIAVYAVSLTLASVELKGLEDELKKLAVLKVEGRKEVRPTRVVAVEMGGGMANVIYFFPRSAHITAEDQRLEFDGQVGRIVFAQYFYPAEMKFLGKLEL
jgi:hypothetical protein